MVVISVFLRAPAFYRRNPGAENRQSGFTFLMASRFPSVKPGKREMKVPRLRAKTSTVFLALPLNLDSMMVVSSKSA